MLSPESDGFVDLPSRMTGQPYETKADEKDVHEILSFIAAECSG